MSSFSTTIGYDSINVKITPCIGRESKKLLSVLSSVPAAPPPDSKKCKVTGTLSDTPAVPPLPEGVLDFTQDNPPDKDGYYHFSVSFLRAATLFCLFYNI